MFVFHQVNSKMVTLPQSIVEGNKLNLSEFRNNNDIYIAHAGYMKVQYWYSEAIN